MANDERLTLSVDCGGLFLKSCALDESGTMHSKPGRIETPYPLSPERFIETIKEISDSLPPTYRATIGMPGMIRHGVVISTPHYMTKSGPRTRIDPELQEQWSGFDMQSALGKKLAMPTRVLNDAEVHGAGIISGSGYEVVITLGTGLGFAIFNVICRKSLEKGANDIWVTAQTFGVAALFSAPCLFAESPIWLTTRNGILTTLWLGIFTTSVGYILFMYGLKRIPSSLAATVVLAEPATATILAAVVIGEPLVAQSYLGIATVALGILYISKSKRGSASR